MQNDRRLGGGGDGSALGDRDLEGGAGDVVVPPFYGQHIAASLLEQVADVVLTAACMFHQHLLARDQRPPDTHHQHVLTWGGTQL